MEEFYKNKIIRNFLTLFSESKWKNLCILCMEYGVLTLKTKYQVSSLSMEDIEEFVNDLVEQEKIKNQKNLKKLRQDIGSNANAKDNIRNSKISNTNSNYNSQTSFKPSSDWRKGENKTIFDGCDDNNFNNNYINPNYANNYHYNKNSNMNNNNYGFTESSYNEESAYSKKGKEKLIDDILYPKKQKIVNYHKDNVFNNQLPKNQQLKQYKTSYNDSYTIKKNNNYYNTSNSSYNNYNVNKRNYGNSNSNFDFGNTSFGSNNQNSVSRTMKRSLSSAGGTRFKSGLQKLRITKPLQGKKSNNDSMNSSFSVRGNYSNKINNVSSKIKSQVDADKKIHGMLRKNSGNFKYY